MNDEASRHGSTGEEPTRTRPAGGSGGDAQDGIDIHRLLVASVRDYAIFVLDPTGHILTWNLGAERLKGYTSDEIIGRHFSIFYTQPDIERNHPARELAIAQVEGRYEEEGWRLRRDGSRFWASVTITALRDPAGNLVGFAKVTRDLTERKLAQDRAVEDARRLAEAEAANRAKSDFLAAMSHELRTPLNAIGGYVDLLIYGVHGPLSDAQVAALERVRLSQRHLLGLINDLLNFSRIEAGRINYDLAPVALASVADAVGPMVEPQAETHGVDVEWQPRDDTVVAVADRSRLEQIVLNLLTNAVKYTPAGGHVTVRYFRLGSDAHIEVSDTGIGIPADYLDAIFEPFTQVGRSYSTPHEGTGLGLAISRDLARAMGGDLRVRSTVGEGSTFMLSLPATDEAPVREQAEVSEDDADRVRQDRIRHTG